MWPLEPNKHCVVVIGEPEAAWPQLQTPGWSVPGTSWRQNHVCEMIELKTTYGEE